MSLVPWFVFAEDGRYYECPIVCGPAWFVCFDDDDPPELSWVRGTKRPRLPWLRPIEKPRCGGSRQFGGVVKDMRSQFGRLVAPIPVPDSHDGVYDSFEELKARAGDFVVFGVRFDWARKRRRR